MLGAHAERDRGLGLRVFAVCRLAADARGMAHGEVARLLLAEAARRAALPKRDAAAELYLAHQGRIDNGDLAGTSAPPILGTHVEADGTRPCWTIRRCPSECGSVESP